jgi:4-hydroxy-tetrahydrodipicolinate reductase
MEVRPIRVVQYGLGASGKDIARLIDQTPGFLLVGGIDHNPDLIGQDLGNVIGLGRQLSTPVEGDPLAALSSTYPDVVVLATTSQLTQTYPQIATCLRARVNVVSTCEELVYPYVQHPQLANNLNELAREGRVSVIGVGINPGFVQDLLPLMLTGPCANVERITATRVFSATIRRASIHQRIGAGYSVEEFHRRMDANGLPHTGLRESVHLIAHSIGWDLDRVDERIDPIVSDEWVHDERVTIAPGQVVGARQTASGVLHGREVIALTWQVSLEETVNSDTIIIDGTPPIKLKIEGGIHGGEAAPAMVLHALAPIVEAAPGLHTVAELPPLHYRAPAHLTR